MRGVLFRLERDVTRDLAKRHLSGDGIISSSRRRSQEEVLKRANNHSLGSPSSYRLHEYVKHSVEHIPSLSLYQDAIDEDKDEEEDRYVKRAMTRHSEAAAENDVNFFSFSDASDSGSNTAAHNMSHFSKPRMSRAFTSVDGMSDSPSVSSTTRKTLSRPSSASTQSQSQGRDSRADSIGSALDSAVLQQCEVVVEGFLHRCCSDGVWRKR
jgi:hypothetical protein